jgi:xanthine dehydrogenase small subunit
MSVVPAFRLNGDEIGLAGSDPTESLLRWLKRRGLPGSKEGCGDGDCGACTVVLVECDAGGRSRFRAVNSCLLPLGLLPGRELYTVEALAEGEHLHPVQQALVDCAGSQCGYCTPGFVMSLFAGLYSGELDDTTIEGNLCRCTGYRPIRVAMQRLRDARTPRDRFTAVLAEPRQAPPATAFGDFHSPGSVDEALALKQRHPQAVWIAGASDLGVEFSRGKFPASACIALDRVPELQRIEIGEQEVRIGAGVSLSRIEDELHGLFPALDQMLPWFAGRQVRNRATFGGNLGTASPIGDLLPVLLALDARIHCRGLRGERAIPAAEFFRGYRKTALGEDELIAEVGLPRRAGLVSGALKLAKRPTDDISIVVAAFALGFDGTGRIDHARLAYGGVAALPLRALRTEAFLLGRPLDADTVAMAAAMLAGEFTPLSDHRAGAGYRRALCGQLFAKFVAEQVR